MGIRRSLVVSSALFLVSAWGAAGRGQVPAAPVAPAANAIPNAPATSAAPSKSAYLDEALALCNQTLAREPTGPNLLCRAKVYFQRQEWHNAIVDATTAAKVDPANALIYYLFRSQVHRVTGDFDEAIHDAEMVVLLKPQFPEGYFARALAHSKSGHHRAAVSDLDKVLELQPTTVLAYVMRGNAHRTLGDDAKSLADYGEALRLSPNDAVLHWHRGNAYWRLHQYAEAQTDYEAAIRLEPNKAEYLLTAASFHATCADEKFRSSQKAFDYVARVGEQTKWADWGSLAALADAYAEAGDFAKAGQALTKALEAAPAAEHPRLQERQTLFQAEKPYRQASPR